MVQHDHTSLSGPSHIVQPGHELVKALCLISVCVQHNVQGVVHDDEFRVVPVQFFVGHDLILDVLQGRGRVVTEPHGGVPHDRGDLIVVVRANQVAGLLHVHTSEDGQRS